MIPKHTTKTNGKQTNYFAYKAEGNANCTECGKSVKIEYLITDGIPPKYICVGCRWKRIKEEQES